MSRAKRPLYLDGDYQIIPAKKDPDLANYQSLVRMLVGSLLVGSEELLTRVRAWEEAHPRDENSARSDGPTETELALLRHLLVGMLFHGPELVAPPLLSLADTADRALGIAGSLMGPIMGIPIFRPARKRWRAYQHKITATIEAWIETGRREEPYSKMMAQHIIPGLVDDIIGSLSENAAIQTLIQAQVGLYLRHASENPAELDRLVQTVADRYIGYLNTSESEAVQALVQKQVRAYLNTVQEDPDELVTLVQVVGDRYLAYLKEENPEALQAIIQGQSLGLASEITDELRARTVTSDSILEMFMRSLLRRPARQELPLPPPEVLNQATMSIEEVIHRRNAEKRHD